MHAHKRKLIYLQSEKNIRKDPRNKKETETVWRRDGLRSSMIIARQRSWTIKDKTNIATVETSDENDSTNAKLSDNLKKVSATGKPSLNHAWTGHGCIELHSSRRQIYYN